MNQPIKQIGRADELAKKFIAAATRGASAQARGEPGEFVALISDAIVELLAQEIPMTEEALRDVGDDIRHALETMCSQGFSRAAAIFPGLAITGANLTLAANSSVALLWETDFYPAPLHPRHPGECTPLGTFDGHDLYVARQGFGLPDTFVARYGSGSGDYSTYNPTPAGGAAPSWVEVFGDRTTTDDAAALFAEALRRANQLGVL
ncbi:hypothetical protein [Burkholderia ubonensis]|uniref:Uncharacterized protein n=1 Tax=Burkholderia ubonensis TaxID=101571 RepID=A0ABD4DZA7_9BURK|nr:hypothetical protein [Burkholderia ubonensis]KVN83441.1 hypothetical protein WJ68_16135 [Burkholderia ubonensis]